MELIFIATITHIVVEKEKKMKVIRFKLGKKKTFGIRLHTLSYGDQLVDNMSNTSDSTILSKDRKKCSISKIMSEFHLVEGVNIEDDFHEFAIEFYWFKKN